MKLLLATTLTWVLTLALPPESAAGAWTQSHRGYYLKLAALSFTTSDQWDADGKSTLRMGSGELSDLGVNAYMEYGVTPRLTVVASLPYKRVEDTRAIGQQQEVTVIERAWGLGDLEARLRWSLRTSPVVLSVAAGGKIPLGYGDSEVTPVPLGTGKLDGDVRLLAGRSFHPLPLYTTGEIGYRSRGGHFSNELLFSAEVGYSIGRLMLKTNLSGVRTRGDCGDAEMGGGLFGDQSWIKLSPGIIYNVLPRMELGLEAINVADGCNMAAGTTFVVGAAYKR